MHSCLRYAFPSLAALCGFTAQTQAAVIGIDDFSGGETVIGFDDDVNKTSTITIGDATFTALSDSDFYTWSTAGYFDNVPGSSQGNGIVVDGLTQTFQISFNTTVYRAGLLLSTDIVNTWTMIAYDSNGLELGWADFEMSNGGDAVFAGVGFSVPIASLVISDPDGDNHATAFDDLRFDSIPEPATLMLLATGLGIILCRGSQRCEA